MEAGWQRWHVQVMGSGPPLLLVHGVGSATHSWRDLAPRLATRFTVIAPDLPGHGFTTSPRSEQLTLDGIASDLDALVGALGIAPVIGVGHGLGAAILMRMALDAGSPFRALVGIGATLTPPRGQYWSLLAPGTRAGERPPLVVGIAARLAASGAIGESLMRSTGSRLQREQWALYEAFLRSGRHMGAVHALHAGWNARALQEKLGQLTLPVTLIAPLGDPWVPPREAGKLAMRLPSARIVEVPRAGHLVHEEEPLLVAAIVIESAILAAVVRGAD